MWKHGGKRLKVISKGCVDPDRIPLQCDYLNGEKPYWRTNSKNNERKSKVKHKRNNRFGIDGTLFNTCQRFYHALNPVTIGNIHLDTSMFNIS